MCFVPQRRALFWNLNFRKWCERVVFSSFSLRNLLRATTPCTFSTSQLPKMLRSCSFLYMLTSKCASRHTAVHFFNISTSKNALGDLKCFLHFYLEMCFASQRVHFLNILILTSKNGPNIWCFYLFDFQRCFAPQPRALFRGLNFHKCSEHEVLWPFGFHNLLLTTLASLLFDPPRPLNISFRTPASTFFSDSFFSLTFFLLPFSSLIFLILSFSSLTLPTSAFPSVDIVGSLTSKLPSANFVCKACMVQIVTVVLFNLVNISWTQAIWSELPALPQLLLCGNSNACQGFHLHLFLQGTEPKGALADAWWCSSRSKLIKVDSTSATPKVLPQESKLETLQTSHSLAGGSASKEASSKPSGTA